MSVISRQTSDDLAVVMSFFGIEPEFNRHLFRYAVDKDRDAFTRTVGHLANAVRADIRYGVGARLKAKIAAEKAAEESAGESA